MSNWVKLTVKKETKELLMNDCVAVFLKHHPEFEGKNMTQEHILRWICRCYLS